MHLLADAKGDVERILTVRRVRPLGRRPSLKLSRHFERFGAVEDVLSYLLYNSHGSARSGDMVFVVMASARDARRCLAEGGAPVVEGCALQVARFQHASRPAATQWQ